MTIETIKFSQMIDGGNIANDDKVPGLLNGGNVLFNNPWTFLPPGSTADRPTPSPTINYRLRFNTDVQLYEYYDAILGAWTQLQESLFTVGPFVIYQADASIPDGQNLGALSNGILKQTVTTGSATLAIALNGTDYYGPGFTGYYEAPAGIKDINGNIVLNFNGVSNAVNYLESQNAPASSSPSLNAKGSDSNISMVLMPKGDAGVAVFTSSVGSTPLQIYSGTSHQHVNNFMFANTANTVNVTFQDTSGTVAYLSDVAATVTSAQGTQNQVLVNGTFGTPETGAVILTLPQNIGTTNSPTFNDLTLTGGLIKDTNGNNVFGMGATASAVNYLQTVNSATGVAVQLEPVGTDTNIQLTILSKNAGPIIFGSTATVNQNTFFTGSGYQHLTVFSYPSSAATRNVSWQDASGTVAFLTDIPSVTPSAMTSANDTNVTLTLSGTPATSLLQPTTLTMGWTGILSSARGGTGVNNGTNTLTLGGNLTTSGAFSSTFTMTGATSVTFPTSGTLATTSQLPTGAALTEVNDTNVTLTLGGSPTTALLNATSLTLGWTGTLSPTRGGTGINNGSNTLTLAGNLATSGAFASTFTMTGATSVTFPTSGTLATTSQLPTPAALTKTDDTNVTLTLGGTPATALLQATSLTLGWTGQLSVTRGGTGLSSATAYAVLCGGTTSTGAFQSIASVGTSNQLLMSNGAGALPSFKSFSTILVAPTIQKFTSGSGTYTTPTSPAPLYIRIVMVGGGAGGGGSGTTPGTPTAGGNTTFGTTLLVGNGGAAGSQAAGGTASLGSGPVGIAVAGEDGGSSPQVALASGTRGANSFFGGGGTDGQANNNGGAAKTNTGSGGGGAGGTATLAASFGGAAGGYVDAIITSPSATYSYAVGAAGTGASAGTGGAAGGNGAAGIIVVYEFYQ